MKTKAISTHIARSCHSSTRKHLSSAWPILRSSFPKLTSTHQFPGATSALPPNLHPSILTRLLPLGGLPSMAGASFRNINASTSSEPIPGTQVPRPDLNLLTAAVSSSLEPEIPSDLPQNPDIPMPAPPTHDPGQTPPSVEPPSGPPEVTPPPNPDLPPGVDPIPDIPAPTPSPDFPSPPIPSPSKPEIPSEPRNPEMPVPPIPSEPGYDRPDFGLPKGPPEVTPPSPPEIIPPQIL